MPPCRQNRETSGLSGKTGRNLYYNVKDPMLQKEMEEDLDELDPEIFKKLKMNGLVMDDRDVIENLDRTTISLPLSYTTKGTLRKGSSVASETEFELLDAYVRKKSLISGNRY